MQPDPVATHLQPGPGDAFLQIRDFVRHSISIGTVAKQTGAHGLQPPSDAGHQHRRRSVVFGWPESHFHYWEGSHRAGPERDTEGVGGGPVRYLARCDPVVGRGNSYRRLTGERTLQQRSERFDDAPSHGALGDFFLIARLEREATQYGGLCTVGHGAALLGRIRDSTGCAQCTRPARFGNLYAQTRGSATMRCRRRPADIGNRLVGLRLGACAGTPRRQSRASPSGNRSRAR